MHSKKLRVIKTFLPREKSIPSFAERERGKKSLKNQISCWMHCSDRQTSSRLSEKLSTRPSIFFCWADNKGLFWLSDFLSAPGFPVNQQTLTTEGRRGWGGHKFARGAMTDAFEVRESSSSFRVKRGRIPHTRTTTLWGTASLNSC